MELTGWERLSRDWPTLSENERVLYTVKILQNTVDLTAMRAALNNACGTGRRLSLPELQAIRFVVERLSVLD